MPQARTSQIKSAYSEWKMSFLYDGDELYSMPLSEATNEEKHATIDMLARDFDIPSYAIDTQIN